MRIPRHTELFSIFLLLACFSRPILASSGFCVLHYSNRFEGNVRDHYVFYALLEGLDNSSYHSPRLLETQFCRTGHISLLHEIGEGSLIAPPMVNACESVCNLLLQDVRTREGRRDCKFNEELTKRALCEDKITPDRFQLRPPPTANTRHSSAHNQSGPPETTLNGTSNTGSNGYRFGPGTDGSGEDSGFTETPLFLGPNNSTKSSECDAGLGNTYKEGDSFCRGSCGNLVDQVLLRLAGGLPSLAALPAYDLLAFWMHMDVWYCP